MKKQKKKIITFMKSCPSSVFSFSMVDGGSARPDPSLENSEDEPLSRCTQRRSTLWWCDQSDRKGCRLGDARS